MIYKIFRTNEWTALQDAGETAGAPIDRKDGFIHFSTAAQVHETAAKHFADVPDLWLAALDEGLLGDRLKWQVSRGNSLFPHLFRSLRLDDILWCVALPLGENGHVFPAELA